MLTTEQFNVVVDPAFATGIALIVIVFIAVLEQPAAVVPVIVKVKTPATGGVKDPIAGITPLPAEVDVYEYVLAPLNVYDIPVPKQDTEGVIVTEIVGIGLTVTD